MKLDPTFLALLRSGLYRTDPAPTELEAIARLELGQWKEIIQFAREQTVTGIIGDAVTRLPGSVHVPESILYTVMGEMERIRYRSRRITLTADKIEEVLQGRGFHPLVMKGPAVATFYPDPLLRISGDIDLYLPSQEIAPVREWIASTGLKVRPAPDGSFHFNTEGTDVDVHDTYYDLHRDASLLPAIPSAEATLLMLSAHILKHAAGTGVGLRQCCDLALAYQGLSGQYDPDALKKWSEQAGLLKWNQLLSAFLNTRLLADVPSFSPVQLPDPQKLDRIVLDGGNFGHFAARRTDALKGPGWKRKMDTVRCFLRRLPFSLTYAPHETFARIGDLVKGNLSHP